MSGLNETALARAADDVGALLVKHTAKAAAGSFTRYANDPLGFCRDVLKVRLWSKQDAFVQAMATPDARVVVAGCHASGKDFASACIALWWVYAHEGFVVATSATDRQVRVAFMGEVRRRFSPRLPGELYEMSLQADRTIPSGVLAFATTETSRFSGIHAPRMLVILSEAQGLPAEVWDGAFAIATGDDVRLLALGNPVVAAGKFYDVYRNPRWTAVQMSALEHPNVLEGKPIVPGGPSRAWVAEVAREYGTESAYYIGRVQGEFPEDASETLVRRRWLEAAAERWEARAEIPLQAHDYVLAVDPARYGPDKTAVAIRRGAVLEEIVVWSQKDMMETVGKLRVLASERDIDVRTRAGREALVERGLQSGKAPHRAGRFVVDEIGLGGGVVDRLKEEKLSVAGFNASRPPSSPDAVLKYLNQRAESFWNLRKLLEAGAIALPRDPVLWEELCALMWKVTSAGKIQIEAKEEFRARLGRSPDRADAVAMAFHPAIGQRWQVTRCAI